MKTLTVTKARGKLSDLLWRAIQGEDIGVIHSASGEIVALRPVRVYSEDYALIEYGASEERMKKIDKRLSKQKGKVWDGTTAGLRG